MHRHLTSPLRRDITWPSNRALPITEARFYDIPPLVAAIQHQMRLGGRAIPNPVATSESLMTRTPEYECVTVHISPDIGKSYEIRHREMPVSFSSHTFSHSIEVLYGINPIVSPQPSKRFGQSMIQHWQIKFGSFLITNSGRPRQQTSGTAYLTYVTVQTKTFFGQFLLFSKIF